MTTRYVTKQQFSDGTTIDGNRIEEAIQSIESLSDNVPYGAVRTRFTQTMIVSGWSPVNDPVALRRNPFLPILNSGTGKELNPTRFKGTAQNSEYPDLVACETSVTFDHSSVLHGLSVFLTQSEDGGVPYQFPGTGTGVPYDPPSVQSVEIHVSVDAEFIPGDRTQADMEIHKYGFNSEAWVVSSTPLGAAPVTEMLPGYPGGNLTGWSIDLKDLNIPIRAFGVARIALIIPDETASAVWGTRPWRNFSPTITATFLEPTRDV
tara:strand:- start:325 stop:1113 length:789 start_codon:yes stop_codon:yes gene_type:complete